MRRWNPEVLSEKYQVRILTQEDIPAVLELMRGNPQYYRYCGGDAVPTEQGIRRDMSITPPGTAPEDKYYVGFFQNETLAAVMDLIDGYPDGATAFIGFFMLNMALQGTGEGSRIISHLCGVLGTLGCQAVRLGIDEGNPQSTHFWQKNGFQVIRRVPQEQGVVLLAERRL